MASDHHKCVKVSSLHVEVLCLGTAKQSLYRSPGSITQARWPNLSVCSQILYNVQAETHYAHLSLHISLSCCSWPVSCFIFHCPSPVHWPGSGIDTFSKLMISQFLIPSCCCYVYVFLFALSGWASLTYWRQVTCNLEKHSKQWNNRFQNCTPKECNKSKKIVFVSDF